jgi:hypothetical protein
MTAPRRSYEMVVDRFEGEIAVVEVSGGHTLDLPRWMLPPQAAEGDVIRAHAAEVDGAWRVECTVDAAETARRRDRAKGTLDRLRKRDPGGDVDL